MHRRRAQIRGFVRWWCMNFARPGRTVSALRRKPVAGADFAMGDNNRNPAHGIDVRACFLRQTRANEEKK